MFYKNYYNDIIAKLSENYEVYTHHLLLGK